MSETSFTPENTIAQAMEQYGRIKAHEQSCGSEDCGHPDSDGVWNDGLAIIRLALTAERSLCDQLAAALKNLMSRTESSAAVSTPVQIAHEQGTAALETHRQAREEQNMSDRTAR